MELVGLIGCGKKKLDTKAPVPASRLYIDGLFRSSLRFAQQRCNRVFVVSDQYGLVDLAQPLLPYNSRITEFCRGEQKAWAIKVVRTLSNKMGKYLNRNGEALFQTVILTNAPYADLLHAELQWNKIPSCRPLKDLGYKERLRWLSTNAKSHK